jgi:hypothetical protein
MLAHRSRNDPMIDAFLMHTQDQQFDFELLHHVRAIQRFSNVFEFLRAEIQFGHDRQ